jgi:DNA-binding NarL/FixJ family response regulator
MSCRIVVADDHQIMRQCLRALLEKEPDMQVVGEARDGRQALHLVRELLPDVAIIDVKMPNLNGIEAVRHIHSELPHVKVIALSMHADLHSIKNMLKAGACIYLLKDCASEELAQAIRLAMSNRIFLDPGLTDLIVKDYTRHDSNGAEETAFAKLKAREREVLQLVSEGKRSAQIAEALHISIKTVETHRANIMQKLNIRNVAQLTKYALREGLTSLEDVRPSSNILM